MLFRLTSHLRERERERELINKASFSSHGFSVFKKDLRELQQSPSSMSLSFSLVLGLINCIMFGGESSSGSTDHCIKVVPTHGGRYIQYNVYGQLFEVSRKYVPPIRPIGRGACGIVW